MSYLIIAVNILLGASISSIAAHPRLCNLDLYPSLKIGLLSGVIASVAYLAFQFFYPGNEVLFEALSVAIVLLAGAVLVLWNFFRDPARTPPSDKDVIISPADGRIIYAKEVGRGVIPDTIKGKKCIRLKEIAKTDLLSEADGYIMGICMNILDVHVTRAPIDGTVLLASDIPGKTLSPKNWRSEIDNPRTTLILDGQVKLGLVEIGTPYVSKIIKYVRSNETVKKGDRIGRITWGSQFDVIIPSRDVEILVKEGDHVYAGETVLARLKRRET